MSLLLLQLRSRGSGDNPCLALYKWDWKSGDNNGDLGHVLSWSLEITLLFQCRVVWHDDLHSEQIIRDTKDFGLGLVP